MTSLIKLGIMTLAVLGVVVGNGGVGWAGLPCPGAPCTVKIDDLTELPTVTVFDPSISQDVTSFVLTVASGNNPAGEFLHFTLPLFGGPPNQSFAVNLFEDHVGGILSDRLVATTSSDGNTLDVQFASDPAAFPSIPGGVTPTQVVENGFFQSFFTVSDDASYTFQVRSDVDPVPAPATLLLVGSGLAGLGAVGWRRKRG